MKKNILLSLFSIFSISAQANDSLAMDTAAMIERYNFYIDSVEQTFNYQYGEIKLKNDIATLQVPAGFKYLDGETSEMVLTDLWGNPPSAEGYESLGMLMKEVDSPLTDSSFCINITYAEEGYINDDDAKDIDYDDLLETMQEDTKAANEYRLEQGYDRIELIGWASPPFYDEENKKLHWAKELKFGDHEGVNTLNYNIRILGRKGYLELNAIGEMPVLDKVRNEINPILKSVNFNKGNTYGDFNPDIDEVAAYGIGGLIAGKLLLKAGILAKLGVFLAKFWKFILLGIAGIGAGIKKFFSK